MPQTALADRPAHSDLANAVRALAMDAVEKAKSGHPGLPMGTADLATVLFTQVLTFDAAVPRWQEFRRNIWEFPDYMDLPIAPSPELAENDTRSPEKHPPTSADRQTALPALNALDHNDIASEAPSNAAPAMIATSQ